MGAMADRRRRQIARKGHPMTLTRAGIPPVSLVGYGQPPGAPVLIDDVPRATVQIETTNDELSAVGFGRPQALDKLQDGDRLYTLSDAQAIYDAEAVIGWRLFALGGE